MPPITVMIKPVSGACNMRCRYCFYADEMNNRGTDIYPAMDDETLETLVRRVMRYADKQATFVFQGGEPTLAGVGFYQKLLALQKKYRRADVTICNSLQTNGYHLTDEMIDLFARNRFLLGVSLDGCEMTHDLLRKDARGEGTFSRVLENIRRLQKANVEFNILCVVNNAVAEHADAVLDRLCAFDYLQFIPCLDNLDGTTQPHSLTAEAYSAFLEKAFARYQKAFMTKRRLSIRTFDNWVAMLLGMPPENCAMRGVCSPGFLVESTGDVYPCDFYALDEWKLGNIREHSLRQLHRTPQAKTFEEVSLPVPDRCRSCPWYALCRNGCRRERDPQTGLYRFCSCMEAFFSAHMDELKLLASAVRNNP